MSHPGPANPLCRCGRSVGVIIATGALALMTAACNGGASSARSGGSPTTGPSSTGSPSAVAFSVCMRGHGVPDFPDPPGNGRPLPGVDAQQFGVSSSLYQAAEHACRPALPASGTLAQQAQQCLLFGDCPQSLVRQILTVEQPFARCMRANGEPNFPDPSISAKGDRPVFDLSDAGIDPQSAETPQFLSKEDGCRRQSGGSVPLLPST